jgi:hypothetical protein
VTRLAAVAPLASGFQVSGVHGFLILLAAIAFLVAAIVAWVVAPRAHWATAVAVGLLLFAVSFLVT